MRCTWPAAIVALSFTSAAILLAEEPPPRTPKKETKKTQGQAVAAPDQIELFLEGILTAPPKQMAIPSRN